MPPSRCRCGQSSPNSCSTANTCSTPAACWARSSRRPRLNWPLLTSSRLTRRSRMNKPSAPELARAPLSEERIADDVFRDMRGQNLARWPSGADVDFDETVELHQRLPRHKQLGWVMRKAVAERRCLTQPRGGFGTFEMQLNLMVTLDQEGLADIVPTTTDSYTRNE